MLGVACWLTSNWCYCRFCVRCPPRYPMKICSHHCQYNSQDYVSLLYVRSYSVVLSTGQLFNSINAASRQWRWEMSHWTNGVTGHEYIRNEETRDRYGGLPIVEKLKERRLQWYGHLTRSDENLLIKIAIEIDGKQPKSRSKQLWPYMLDGDLRASRFHSDYVKSLNRSRRATNYCSQWNIILRTSLIDAVDKT